MGLEISELPILKQQREYNLMPDVIGKQESPRVSVEMRCYVFPIFRPHLTPLLTRQESQVWSQRRNAHVEWFHLLTNPHREILCYGIHPRRFVLHTDRC